MKKIIILLLSICVSLSSILLGCENKTKQSNEITDAMTSTAKEYKEVSREYVPDGSINDFKEFFNAISSNLALDVYIKDFNVDKNKFEAILDDQLYKGTKLFGELNKDGNIKIITLACEKAEEENEILRYNLLMQSVTSITSQKMNPKQRGEFMYELGMPKDDITLKDGTKVISKDGHTYNFKIEGQKLVFTISI